MAGKRHLDQFLRWAFGISWGLWLPAIVLSHTVSMGLAVVLYFIGGFGPSAAGMIMVYRTQDEAGQRDFIRRAFGFRRIGARWYGFILVIFPLLLLAVVELGYLVDDGALRLSLLEDAAHNPLVLVVMAGLVLAISPLMLFPGPLSEELGWRGFALDHLLARRTFLAASLILGAIWSLWHLPLFFVRDSMYYEWGFGTILFWLFLIRMTAFSVLFTWVYCRTNRSILSAILLHMAYNYPLSMIPVTDSAHVFGTGLMIVLAALAWNDWNRRSHRSQP
ncbi:MAG: CPBP family intramembrane metalloprotease [Anaerolineae bacterium]|nr:CPBP family intramembrane metalloprotease [Anaerolineae bacterium]